MILLWIPSALPRTMTRAEWRAIDGWRRATQKRLAKERPRAIDDLLVDDLLVYGASHSRIMERIVERLVHPPLLVHPAFEAALKPSPGLKSRTCDLKSRKKENVCSPVFDLSL